jgi:feruloyl esterase
MLPGFTRGYATMTTDLGHINTPPGSVEDASWALGHPEKVIDYEYRGEHLSALAARQIVAAYYGGAPAHSYYTGCSAGGIQGMTEALRYPSDFDGYIFGDATPDHLGQEMLALWNTLVASLANEAEALQPAQISLVHNAILKQCVGRDGGASTDAFLTDPPACKFEPKTLRCAAGQDPATCLSAEQVKEFEEIYQGPQNTRTHEQILSGLTLGTEMGWDRYFSGKKNPAGVERPWAGFLVDMVYSDPDFLSQEKYLKFDFDKDYTDLRQRMVAGESLDSSWNTRSRNLEPIRAAGGKVIHYHGWDDPNIPALEAVRFFDSVVADQAERRHLASARALDETETFYRLFMVPGMGHCNGGEGATSFGQGGKGLKDDPQYDTMLALEQWVEKGVAPEQFIGSRADPKSGTVDLTRPICAYPKIPKYKGTGNTAEASSFSCVDNPRLAAKGNSK